MMLIFILITLFLLTLIMINSGRYLMAVVLALGTLFDLFWVLPLGTVSFCLTIFALVLYLYGQKYSYYNQLFLFTILVVAAVMAARLTNQALTSGNIFIFSLLFFLLCLKLRHTRQQIKRKIG
jgi:hypothetical protein